MLCKSWILGGAIVPPVPPGYAYDSTTAWDYSSGRPDERMNVCLHPRMCFNTRRDRGSRYIDLYVSLCNYSQSVSLSVCRLSVYEFTAATVCLCVSLYGLSIQVMLTWATLTKDDMSRAIVDVAVGYVNRERERERECCVDSYDSSRTLWK